MCKNKKIWNISIWYMWYFKFHHISYISRKKKIEDFSFSVGWWKIFFKIVDIVNWKDDEDKKEENLEEEKEMKPAQNTKDGNFERVSLFFCSETKYFCILPWGQKIGLLLRRWKFFHDWILNVSILFHMYVDSFFNTYSWNVSICFVFTYSLFVFLCRT